MNLPPIVWLICATTLIRIAFAATTGLGVDESYMVTAGRVLSLGYFDHPPAAWWLSQGAAMLFGSEAPVVVRLPFILLFAVSQALMFRIGCVVADRRAGFWAVVALNLSPVFGITTGSWVLPDGPLDAALLGAAFCLLKALDQPASRAAWWAGAGLCAGLALFSKYSAVLPMAGAVLFVLTSRDHRRWLARPGPYLAVVLMILVFSPVLIWNATHSWASFAFQGDRAAGLRFRPFAPFVTLGGEALFVLPWIWLPMMVVLVRGFRRGADWRLGLLSWLAVPPIAAFALISASSAQRILFHWAAPGYLMLFPPLGALIAAAVDRAWMRRVIAGTAALVIASVSVTSLQIQFDWLGGALASVMRKDPTDEGLDWTSVRDDLRARGLLPPGVVVAAMGWRDAGKLGYALGPDVTMLCLSDDARQFGFAEPARDFIGRDVLVLVPDPAGRAAEDARRWFQAVDLLDATEVRLRGRVLRGVTVLRGAGLRGEGLKLPGR
jgi:4-amino-4-deoxy-L-arabinose transferase-like glycosyltransferase